MKYRVIGWTDYDNNLFEDGELSDAATFAIVDDIKKNGYMFSGWDHQEQLYGAPVLNDGKRRTYSQRGFGAIMAMAHGDEGDFAYSLYAFAVRAERTIMPEVEAVVGYKPDSELSECFELSLSAEDYALLRTEGAIEIADSEALRMIDKGDTLLVTLGSDMYTHSVSSAERTQRGEDTILKITIEVEK